jgi:hypothetical protein
VRGCRKVEVAIKGQHGSWRGWNVLHFDCIKVKVLVLKPNSSSAISYHRENREKGTKDCTMLLFMSACEYMIISELNFKTGKRKATLGLV